MSSHLSRPAAPERSAGLRRAVGILAALLLAAGSTLAIGSPAVADAARSQQWYLSALGIPAAQAISQGEGVTVAVIDTGVTANQPDIAGSVLDGFDTTPGSTGNGQQDTNGHGTQMAAIIAGHGHGPGNADGVLGVAPRAKILPIKLDEQHNAFALASQVVAAGIDAAVARGAKVINASFAAPLDETVHQAVLRALDHDVVFVAGGGNTGQVTDALGTRDKEIVAPAFFTGVLAICGTDRNGNHADVSIPAPPGGFVQFAVCAPAVDAVAAQPNGTYVIREGTSISSAIVAGVAALIRAKYPTMPAYEVANHRNAQGRPAAVRARDRQPGRRADRPGTAGGQPEPVALAQPDPARRYHSGIGQPTAGRRARKVRRRMAGRRRGGRGRGGAPRRRTVDRRPAASAPGVATAGAAPGYPAGRPGGTRTRQPRSPRRG